MLVQRMALFGGNLPRPAFASVAWGTVIVPNDGGGEFNITFSLSNVAGGEYINLTFEVAGTSPYGPSTSGPYPTTSPLTQYPPGGLWSGDTLSATLDLYSATNDLLDTYVLPTYYC